MLKKLIGKSGIDTAIFYSILARAIQAGGGFFSMVLIAVYLNGHEQGYYFTFGSILAIQVFFELGLSNIITQFVAHEVAQLQWRNEYEIDGNRETLSRLASLLRFCIKWFSVLAIILFIILVIAGFGFFGFFGSIDDSIDWHLPWLILAFTTACSLIVSPVLAYLQGLGKIVFVAKLRLFQQIAQLVFLYIGLFLGLKLYASPIASFFSFSIVSIWLFISNYKFTLIYIWKKIDRWVINYQNEIFPFQWRIALSWMSGYFMYQLFNPVIFATDGALAAGQMGMSLAALNGIMAISLSWINTKVPVFSTLIAKKEYNSLDKLFFLTVKQSSLVSVICLVVFLATVFLLSKYLPDIAKRFLPLFPLLLLCLSMITNQLVAALATYLRCHKKEPMLVYSIVLACLTAISTLLFGYLFGTIGIIAGYFIITIFISLGWAYYIFERKRKEWHI